MKSIITVLALLVAGVFGVGINPTLSVVEKFFFVGDSMWAALASPVMPLFIVLMFILAGMYYLKVSDDHKKAIEEATAKAKMEEKKVYKSAPDAITSKVMRAEQAKALKAEYAARAITLGSK